MSETPELPPLPDPRLSPAQAFTMAPEVVMAEVGGSPVVDLAPGNPLSAQLLAFARSIRRGEA